MSGLTRNRRLSLAHMVRSPLLLGLGMSLAIGSAHGQVALSDDQAALAAPYAADAMAEPASILTARHTFRQLGIDYEMTLRGIQGVAGIFFSVRNDQVINKARLRLRYSYSPALLPEMSHLKVTVNDVTVSTIPVPRETAGRELERLIEIDPRLITDYNRINLQLIGHYTTDCEDPDHTSLWANIDRGSELELSWTPLPLADDLALLPVPFFDARDASPLDLPFVFSGKADTDTLESAGVVASWFGALSGYRGARFRALQGDLPVSGNAVVMATRNAAPQGLDLPAITGPTLAVMTHPQDPMGKLLLVMGRDAEELRKAATALALGTPLSGPLAVIDDLQPVAKRKPHDAPNWIPSHRPVSFSELVERPGELTVRGYNPDLVRIRLQLPPDLFTWQTKGLPLDLRYRYTLPEGADQSALNISINDSFVTTLRLNGLPRPDSVGGLLKNRLQTRGRMPIEQPILLPTGPFSANSQLRFHFFFDRPQAAACKNTFPDVSAAIDGDSRIDLSGFHHFMAMPNLAAFGNAGFPFTRMADLSETSVILPDAPGAEDLGNVLTLFGRMGASTGYPSLGNRVAHAGQVKEHADRDLLVLGSRTSQPLFTTWADRLPVGEGDRRTWRLSDWVPRSWPLLFRPDARRTDLPTTAGVTLQADATDVLMMGFESPLKPRRSVVAILADDPARVDDLFKAWFDPDGLRQFQGSVVHLHDGKLRSLAGNETYYVGKLPPLTWLRWYFSQNPLVLSVLIGIMALLMALGVRWLLVRRARRRLEQGGA